MFEVDTALRTRRKKNDIRIFPAQRRLIDKALPEGMKKGSQPSDLGGVVEIMKNPRDDNPVFQSIAEPGRICPVVAPDPESSLRIPIDIDGIERQVSRSGRGNTVARSHEPDVIENQLGWNLSVSDQILPAVDIGKNGLQQPGLGFGE